MAFAIFSLFRLFILSPFIHLFHSFNLPSFNCAFLPIGLTWRVGQTGPTGRTNR